MLELQRFWSKIKLHDLRLQFKKNIFEQIHRLSWQNEPQNESANVHALNKVFAEGNIVKPTKSRKILFLDNFSIFHVIWPCGP